MTKHEKRFLSRHVCGWCEQQLDHDECLVRYGKPCSSEAMAERQLAEALAALDAARKPENYWRQVAEATELTKKGLEQDNVILREERDDLQRDIEKQNKDIDEHQARWQRAELQALALRAALNRIARGAELQAHVMRDPVRTGGWNGAEKVADAFDDIAERARAAIRSDPQK